MTLLTRGPSPGAIGSSSGGNAAFLDAARIAITRPDIAVVSFDVFDTLLKRRAMTPIACFEPIGRRLAAMGMLAPHVFPAQFRAQRVAAERRARERSARERGHHEVTLAAIWHELGVVLAHGAAPEEAAAAEFAVERDGIFGSAPALDLLALAQARGKRAVLVSDTYFRSEQVALLLRHAAADRRDIDHAALRILASCEHGTGKAGALFDVLLRDCGAPPGAIVHLGDNPHADIEPAARRGMVPVLLPNGLSESWEILHAEARYHGAPGTFEADGSATGTLASLRNLALLEGMESGAFDHFAFGCFVLGPIFDLYLRWVERMLAASPDAMACGLLREGGFLAELLAARNPARRIVCLGISRLTLTRAALAEVTHETLAAALPLRHAIPVQAYAERIGLSLLDLPRGFWTQSVSALDGRLAEELIGQILAEPALVARIRAEGQAFRDRMRRHVAGVLQGDAPCLLLDLGWAATIQHRLTTEFDMPADRLLGLYLALNDRGLERGLAGLRLAGFLCDGPESDRLAGPALRVVEILEQSATPGFGSVVDYDESGAPLFAADPVAGAQRIARSEVQRGIRAYLAQAERHAAVLGNPETEAEALRAAARAIFLRTALAPTAAERALFADWMHDDSFADGAVDRLVPAPHRRIAPFMTPAQLAGAGFLHTYWPMGASDPDTALLAEQAAAAQLLGDRFALFARPAPLSIEVALAGDPPWTLGAAREIALNAFGRFAMELDAVLLVGGRVLLRVEATRPVRLTLETACFTRAGGLDEEGQQVQLDAAALRDGLRSETDDAAPEPDGAFALPPGPSVLVLRIPERVLAWRGRSRVLLGFHLQDRQPAFGIDPRPDPVPVAKGWFDSLFGRSTPLEAGPVHLDPLDGLLASHGWIIDTAAWRGPDAARLLLEGEGRTLRFEAELVPRADIPRGFGRPIHGLAGCLCRVPLSALTFGRYAPAWEAEFGAHTVRLAAPYAVTFDVDTLQRPLLGIEIIGSTTYA